MVANQQNKIIQKKLNRTISFLSVLCLLSGYGLFSQHRTLGRVKKENQTLRNYANIAQDFTSKIRPNIYTNYDFCNNTNCMTCRAVRNCNDREQQSYDAAISTLKINPGILHQLSQGPQNQ